MELEHRFEVGVPVEQAWELFTDLARVVPSMPGAGLDGVEEEKTLGNVKVKVGPVTAQYKGKAWFLEQDEAARRVVVRAEGRDTRGQGNAKATITANLAESASGTDVSVLIDLAITGRVAQIGRGLIADVSGKLLGEFVDNLEQRLRAESSDAATPVPASGEAVDLVAAAGAPLARRALPALLAVAALVMLAIWLW
jgi:carbon monoxide dehydrogenase subunit G